MMIERKKRLFRAAILWLIETGLSLLRHSATRNAQQASGGQSTRMKTNTACGFMRSNTGM